jgi:hypothetical protein
VNASYNTTKETTNINDGMMTPPSTAKSSRPHMTGSPLRIPMSSKYASTGAWMYSLPPSFGIRAKALST